MFEVHDFVENRTRKGDKRHQLETHVEINVASAYSNWSNFSVLSAEPELSYGHVVVFGRAMLLCFGQSSDPV